MKVEINNQIVNIKEGQTILSAIKSIGLNVPTLCHINDLFPSGACRMCVVEVEGAKNLLPSCSLEASEGMKIKTHSPRVLNARRTILELLLANHPDDCLYCDKNGQCELRNLAEELGIRQRKYKTQQIEHHIDSSSPSIIRDPSKCILCGRCVRVCEEIQTVSSIDFIERGSKTFVAPAFNDGLNITSCVNCGQCVMVCPTGALTEHNNIKEVLNALNDPDKHVIIQHAPAISVTIGEFFNFEPGADVCGQMTGALKQIGFDKVFDTSFTADLTIMEEASELVYRIKNGGKLPMLTSCSPGWIKFVEHFYPEFIPNLSTCKSPQQMLGALIKNYYAEKEKIDPSNIFSVSIMPCTAKKFEANRQEMMSHGNPDIDVSLTTRELAKLFKMLNINLKTFKPEEADNPMGERTSAGKIFGVTGGVMEAAIRTAHYFITGRELETLEVKPVRDLKGIKEASLNIDNIIVNVAVVNGLGNARKVLEDIKSGKKNYHFIEVMTCPGGCISGGGQPYGLNTEEVQFRMKALYDIDNNENIRVSHKNESVKKLYNEYLGEPLGEKSHSLLHTRYIDRRKNKELIIHE
ncbi:MAG: NADH-dependent [FeFe] hydrogenase, group A6 [Cyanobacteriota bacterium]